MYSTLSDLKFSNQSVSILKSLVSVSKSLAVALSRLYLGMCFAFRLTDITNYFLTITHTISHSLSLYLLFLIFLLLLINEKQ